MPLRRWYCICQTSTSCGKSIFPRDNCIVDLNVSRLRSGKPDFAKAINALQRHPNRPQLQLLAERGTRTVAGPMPCVSVIQAHVNHLNDTAAAANTNTLRLQELFFASTNLKAFSICMAQRPRGHKLPQSFHKIVDRFRFTGEEKFPPLERIAFDNYNITREDWPYWRDGLDWSRVTSIAIGPDRCGDILETMQDCRLSLQRFKFTASAGEAPRIDGHHRRNPHLNALLAGFSSLRSLEVREYLIPSQTLGAHYGLRELVMHVSEPWDDPDGARPTLEAAELVELDKLCPDLEVLEIDIARDTDWVSYSCYVLQWTCLFSKLTSELAFRRHSDFGSRIPQPASTDTALRARTHTGRH